MVLDGSGCHEFVLEKGDKSNRATGKPLASLALGASHLSKVFVFAVDAPRVVAKEHTQWQDNVASGVWLGKKATSAIRESEINAVR